MEYYRPIAMTDAARPPEAVPLAGGWCWFDRAEVLTRTGTGGVVPAAEIPGDVLTTLSAPRAPVAGLTLERPRLMGIINVTPDSFSDGGQFFAPDAALSRAREITQAGADILDIGGESTRPGASEVPITDEIARTQPLIAALRYGGLTTPISIDTRKMPVAEVALAAGANLVNDVSALSHDPALAPFCASAQAPVCLMHAQGTPRDMQDNPRYDNVLLDVYDMLAARIAAAEAAGLDRRGIIVDPGIGFGKTVPHNLALLQGLSLFHGLGCPILLGASRKRFIGTLSGAPGGAARMPGSIASALAGVAQGVQIIRVHDVGETRQGLDLWQAITSGDE